MLSMHVCNVGNCAHKFMRVAINSHEKLHRRDISRYVDTYTCKYVRCVNM